MQGTGGLTGDVTNKGVISIIEDYTPTDSDNNGYTDTAVAQGTNRYGIRVTGGSGPMAGSVNNATGASITVEGQTPPASASRAASAAGALTNRGSISVVGENSYGVHTTGDIGGNGGPARAASSARPRGRRRRRSIRTSAARCICRAASPRPATAAPRGPRPPSTPTATRSRPVFPTAAETQNGGAAVRISGSVSRGILLDAPPTPSTDTTITDVDNDGIPDAQETTASLSSFGTAPALLIGSDTGAITIGAVGTGDDAYGLVSKGAIMANSVYDGKAATAVQIGGGAGMATNIAGGARFDNSITSTAYQANSTGVRLTNGANLTGSSTLWTRARSPPSWWS